MTKQELIEEVCKRAEINDIDFEHGFNNLIEVIKNTLSKGEAIYVRGFGTLKPVERKSKVARNVITGETVIVPKRKEPVFKPAKEFKKRVNQ